MRKIRTSPEIERQVIEMYTTRNPDGTWTGCKTIARMLGMVTDTTVQNILKRNGVPLRSAKESHAHGKACKPIKNKPKEGETAPLCKCGCGHPVSWNRAKNKWNAYLADHEFPDQPYKHYDFLYSEYVIKQRTAKSIADDFGVNQGVILRWLRLNKIPARPQKLSLHLSGGVRGRKNPAWKGGIAKWEYSHNWKALCKEIKDRDKWTCQGCGEKRKRWGIHLHVHHKDENKFNNSPENLISLCSKCHAIAHSKNKHTLLCLSA